MAERSDIRQDFFVEFISQVAATAGGEPVSQVHLKPVSEEGLLENAGLHFTIRGPNAARVFEVGAVFGLWLSRHSDPYR